MYFSIRVPSLSRNKLIQGKKNTQRENAEPVKIDFDCVWAHPGVRSRGPPALEEVLLRRSFLPSGSIKSPFENTFEIGGSCERLIKSRVIQISSHAREVWTIASTSLAIRLLRPNKEKVRSTTQRRGRGKASKRLVPWKATDEVKPRGVVCLDTGGQQVTAIFGIGTDQFKKGETLCICERSGKAPSLI